MSEPPSPTGNAGEPLRQRSARPRRRGHRRGGRGRCGGVRPEGRERGQDEDGRAQGRPRRPRPRHHRQDGRSCRGCSPRRQTATADGGGALRRLAPSRSQTRPPPRARLQSGSTIGWRAATSDAHRRAEARSRSPTLKALCATNRVAGGRQQGRAGRAVWTARRWRAAAMPRVIGGGVLRVHARRQFGHGGVGTFSCPGFYDDDFYRRRAPSSPPRSLARSGSTRRPRRAPSSIGEPGVFVVGHSHAAAPAAKSARTPPAKGKSSSPPAAESELLGAHGARPIRRREAAPRAGLERRAAPP